MNENILDVDFTRTLPPTLKDDENMLALAKIVAEELQTTVRLSRLNLIYARIDELEESVLDILAYDLHVDWYLYEYPLAAKRAIIKDSVRVHKRLGTLYAVKKALGSIYPQSEIEEWFDYGGEPFSFRVVLDVTNSKALAEYFAIKKAVDSYKRLTAHMDDLIYQCRAMVEIRVGTTFFLLGSAMAGQHICGTYPQRSTLAGIAGGNVAINTQGDGYSFVDVAAGTRPQRSTAAIVHDTAILTEDSGTGFYCQADWTGDCYTGIRPQVSSQGAVEGVQTEAQVAGGAYNMVSSLTGTRPQTNDSAGLVGFDIEANINGEKFIFDSTQAGTTPHNSNPGIVESAGFVPAVTTEIFAFKSRICGSGYCKK